MIQPRNGQRQQATRPLSARSVVASTLLGMESGHLPSRLLVGAAELFGINEGTTRVALSRMVAAGELETDGGHYRLAGPLAERQARQVASRAGRRRAWSIERGQWELAVVVADRRPARDRVALRDAMRRLKLAELREGVWVRPDNLDAGRAPAARATVDEQCRTFRGRPDEANGADGTGRVAGAALAAELWDLDGWATVARTLRAELGGYVEPLQAGDTSVLAPAFELSATVLRLLLGDPQLPDALLPPGWPGDELRRDYDRYDTAFKALWRDWFRAHR